jgi:multidrug efflux pump subunit AcrB
MARTIRDEVEKARGAADIHIHQRIDYPQMLIEIDRSKAELLGLDVRDVFQTVTTVLNSSIQVDRNFWIDLQSGNQYFIAVQYAEKTDFQLEEVKNIPITGPRSGEVVKLGTLVNFRRLDDGPAEVSHDNLSPVYSIMVGTEGRDIGSLADSIGKKIRKLDRPKGMIVLMKGEYERMNESFGNLGFGLFLASILVYLLMVAQFRSYVSPLIIMFTVPLGLIGVFWTLYLTNTTLNVQSCMGVIFMVGIVVSQSTLVVDFANKQRDQGATVREAIITAATLRLRAVLMTFLATFLDLLPIAIGVGKGSEANIPLGRAVVGGLLCSNFLSLFIVPIMYTLLNRDLVPAAHTTASGMASGEVEPV